MIRFFEDDGFPPTEEEISEGGTKDGGQTEPSVVSHEN